MEGRLLFKNCSLLRADGSAREGLAVVVEGERICAVVPDGDCPVLPGDWAVSCGGRVLMPGRTDCHARMVEALLGEGLQAASVQEVEVLTSFALARALRDGVTCVHDLLEQPRFVRDALLAQRRAAERLGARVLFAHAASTADPAVPFEAQLEQNLDVLGETRGNSRFALGIKDPGALSAAQWDAFGSALRTTGAGVHARAGSHGPRAQARAFRLLGPRALCAEVDPQALALFGAPGPFRACLPGETSLAEAPNTGLGSGTAGSLSGAFTPWSMARGVSVALACTGPWALARRSFGLPFGEVEPGQMADLTLYDAALHEDASDQRRPAEVFRVMEARAAWVSVAGRVVLREGQLLGADFLELAREAAAVLRSARGAT